VDQKAYGVNAFLRLLVVTADHIAIAIILSVFSAACAGTPIDITNDIRSTIGLAVRRLRWHIAHPFNDGDILYILHLVFVKDLQPVEVKGHEGQLASDAHGSGVTRKLALFGQGQKIIDGLEAEPTAMAMEEGNQPLDPRPLLPLGRLGQLDAVRIATAIPLPVTQAAACRAMSVEG